MASEESPGHASGAFLVDGCAGPLPASAPLIPKFANKRAAASAARGCGQELFLGRRGGRHRLGRGASLRRVRTGQASRLRAAVTRLGRGAAAPCGRGEAPAAAHEVRDLLLGPAGDAHVPVTRYWFRCCSATDCRSTNCYFGADLQLHQRILLEVKLWRGTSQRLSQSL